MNTNDLPIDDYYKKREEKNSELIGCCLYSLGIGIVIGIVYFEAKLLIWLFSSIATL